MLHPLRLLCCSSSEALSSSAVGETKVPPQVPTSSSAPAHSNAMSNAPQGGRATLEQSSDLDAFATPVLVATSGVAIICTRLFGDCVCRCVCSVPPQECSRSFAMQSRHLSMSAGQHVSPQYDGGRKERMQHVGMCPRPRTRGVLLNQRAVRAPGRAAGARPRAYIGTHTCVCAGGCARAAPSGAVRLQ